MSKFEQLKGRWKHPAAWDSSDYLSLYIISGTADAPVVTALDLSDNEEFEISEVKFAEDVLSFKSYMPSIQRLGINKFSLNEGNSITFEFTFTIVEEFERDDNDK